MYQLSCLVSKFKETVDLSEFELLRSDPMTHHRAEKNFPPLYSIFLTNSLDKELVLIVQILCSVQYES